MQIGAILVGEGTGASECGGVAALIVEQWLGVVLGAEGGLVDAEHPGGGEAVVVERLPAPAGKVGVGDSLVSRHGGTPGVFD
ncbi:MAG: hypothetical protein VBE63_23220 [Lamprobacter sp.]|nr:hypothetical protein [Lamprobacter sp.]MEA3642827.1 hypothetical protein [Lamprobacter sp.]